MNYIEKTLFGFTALFGIVIVSSWCLLFMVSLSAILIQNLNNAEEQFLHSIINIKGVTLH